MAIRSDYGNNSRRLLSLSSSDKLLIVKKLIIARTDDVRIIYVNIN